MEPACAVAPTEVGLAKKKPAVVVLSGGKKKGRFKNFHEREKAWLKARRPLMEWLESKTAEDTETDPKEKLRSRCNMVFNEIDLDCNGTICMDELHRATVKMGLRLTDLEVEGMMIAADVNEDGTLCSEEFHVMMNHEYDVWERKTTSAACIVL